MEAAPARPRVLAMVAVVLTAALLTSGCGKGDPTSGGRAPSERPSSGPSSDPSGGSTYDSATCVAVRAGIDAFNTGDYDQTVSHFQEAVPLARQAAAADGAGPELRLLLRAVRYYAALPAEQYPQASARSSQFARWKAVTLGLCESTDQGTPSDPTPSDPGQQA